MNNQPIDFESANFALQYSWEVHRQAFGPILDPAFVENQQVRIILINALNHISRREIKRGMELLKEIHPHCIYNEDKAAWTFFVGLCFEMGGAQEQMLEWYAKACEIGHRFYLPYLKLYLHVLRNVQYNLKHLIVFELLLQAPVLQDFSLRLLMLTL